MNLLRSSIRSKLTLWFGASLAVILALYSVGIYFFLRHNLYGELDRKLWEDVESVQETLQDLPQLRSGSVDFSQYKESYAADLRDRWILEVWDDQFTKIFSIPRKQDDPLGKASAHTCSNERNAPLSFRLQDGLNLRALCSKIDLGNQYVYVRVGRSSERLVHELDELLWIMLIGVPIGILLAIGGGYLLARKSLSPVQKMTDLAEQITADRLGERLPVVNPHDELGRLAKAFNTTFERLDKSFQQMRQFTSDASHELRTPLTAIRTMGEVTLREEKSPAEYREVLSSVLEETDELRHLVDSLLTLSRADAGQIKLNKETLSIPTLISEVLEHLEVLAEEKNQKIEIDLQSGLQCTLDRGFFRQALINLVVNAIKYSPKSRTIRVKAYETHGEICVEVSDEGPGIAPEHHKKIFERFYRIDPSRNRDIGGTGLGLAIAKWAIEAHSGYIVLNSEPGLGSRFTIHLPQC